MKAKYIEPTSVVYRIDSYPLLSGSTRSFFEDPDIISREEEID